MNRANWELIGRNRGGSSPRRKTILTKGSNPIEKPIPPQGSKKWHDSRHRSRQLGGARRSGRYVKGFIHAICDTKVIPLTRICKKVYE